MIPRLALIAALILPPATEGQQRKAFTLEQLFAGPAPQFTLPLPTVTGWADDSSYVETLSAGPDSGRSAVIDARTGRTIRLRPEASAAVQSRLPAGIRPDRWSAASEDATVRIYTSDNDLFLLDTRTDTLRRLTNTPAAEKNPTLSPDATHLASTRGNDLFTVDLRTGAERRYTTDDSDVILNGWASWLYWEEIFGRSTNRRAFWWSPDGTRLAFYRFDDSGVPLFPLSSPKGKHGSLEQMRYPKAGDPNPAARLGVASVETGRVTWAAFDSTLDQYFGTPFWTPDGGRLIVQWMNRGQDTLVLHAVNPATGTPEELFRETQPAWVEWFKQIAFLKDGTFIVRSDRDGWAHLYLYGPEGDLHKQLTSGAWQVEDVLLADETKEVVFFTARKEATTRSDLYSVAFDGTGLRRLTPGPYTHSVRLSPGGSFFLTTYSNLDTPPRMALVRGSGEPVRDLGDSRAPLLDEYEIAPTRLVTIPTADGWTLPALLTLPPNPEPGRRYPVIISTYGGPLSPSVSERWQLTAADQGRAYAGLIQMTVDHRGSGHHGKGGAALMHRNLGRWELHDYTEAVRWLRRQPFADSTKICITGSSYGGYVTALALTAGAEYFTHGIAALSVTDWLLYDSHYTERYMDTPSENPEGYRAASVLTHAAGYRGMLRLVHGGLDDNVHVQHALQLADTLQSLNRHFELMVYPDQRHGVGGRKFSHYRSEMMRFYYRHLLEREFPAALFVSTPRMTGGPH